MEKKEYRIVTDGEVFRIEFLQKWSYRAGWFFLKVIHREQWMACDIRGDDCYCDCADGDCYYDESEVVEYNTIEEAQAKIEQWTNPPAKSLESTEPIEPVWKVVWPKA